MANLLTWIVYFVFNVFFKRNDSDDSDRDSASYGARDSKRTHSGRMAEAFGSDSDEDEEGGREFDEEDEERYTNKSLLNISMEIMST